MELDIELMPDRAKGLSSRSLQPKASPVGFPFDSGKVCPLWPDGVPRCLGIDAPGAAAKTRELDRQSKRELRWSEDAEQMT
jgi:hypothetical protein